jgi:hypothetical protein
MFCLQEGCFMPDLVKAFKSMCNHGLVAVCEYLCEGCASTAIAGRVRSHVRDKKRIRGFVHIGGSETCLVGGDTHIKLLFGTTASNNKYSRASVSVGRVIAQCLAKENIAYNWDHVPGSPIYVNVEPSLEGISENLHGHDAYGGLAVRSGAEVPDSAWDLVSNNPVRISNCETIQRLGVGGPSTRKVSGPPSLAKEVKIGFCIQDATHPEAAKEIGPSVHLQTELMWVEVTNIQTTDSGPMYRGELTNAPVLIDPTVLRIGSPITFTEAHVYSLSDK